MAAAAQVSPRRPAARSSRHALYRCRSAAAASAGCKSPSLIVEELLELISEPGPQSRGAGAAWAPLKDAGCLFSAGGNSAAGGLSSAACNAGLPKQRRLGVYKQQLSCLHNVASSTEQRLEGLLSTEA